MKETGSGSEFAAALLLWILTLNGLVISLSSALTAPRGGEMFDLGGISAIIWFALFVLVRLALDAGPSCFAIARKDRLPFALAAVLACIPFKEVSLVALVGLAAFLWWSSEAGSQRRRIAIIGAALVGPVVGATLIRSLLGPELAMLESLLLAWLPGLEIDGNVISAIDGSTRYVVAAKCSAIANISLAILLTVTMAQVARVERLASMAGWAALAVAVVILVNSTRLGALGYYPEHFEYLHEGAGRSLFINMAFVLMCAIAIVGAIHARRREV